MSNYPNDQGNPAAATPVYIAAGPSSASVPAPPTPPPATLAGGATWNSGPMNAAGYSRFAAGATLSQDGSLTLNLYIDPAGTILIDSPGAQTMTANTPATTSITGGAPAASWRVLIQNTSGSTGNLTGVALLNQP